MTAQAVPPPSDNPTAWLVGAALDGIDFLVRPRCHVTVDDGVLHELACLPPLLLLVACVFAAIVAVGAVHALLGSPEATHAIKVFRHKWWVLVYGLKLKVPLWQLLVHDLSKLGTWELSGYAGKFFGTPAQKADEPSWLAAWTHHQNANAHHPEFWVNRSKGEVELLPMPEAYVREMIADWAAAYKEYSGGGPTLLNPRLHVFMATKPLHPQTARRVKAILAELGELNPNMAAWLDEKAAPGNLASPR